MTKDEMIAEIEQTELVIERLAELRADFLQRLEDLRDALANAGQDQDADQ